MATKIKTFENSKSGHAANASLSNQVATFTIWQELAKVAELAQPGICMKAVKAFNYAGYSRLNTIPAPTQAHILFAMTGGAWGYHPYHSDVPSALKLIADMKIAVDARFETARIMLGHPDKSLAIWIRETILDKGQFTVDQKIALGLQVPATVVTTPATQTNVANLDEIYANIAANLGVSIDEAKALVSKSVAPAIDNGPVASVQTVAKVETAAQRKARETRERKAEATAKNASAKSVSGNGNSVLG